jgi:hypothetical protein
LNKAFDLILKRKAIALETSSLQRDAILSGRYPSLESKVSELHQIRLQIADTILQRNDVSDPSTLDQLSALNMRKEGLEAELATQIPEFRLRQKLEVVTHQTILKTLDPKTILVEFVKCPIFDFSIMTTQGGSYWKPARYLAFVLDPKHPKSVRMIDIGNVDSIDRMIAEFRYSITQREDLG